MSTHARPPRPPLAGRLALTRLSLLTERLWERLWPAATLALVFLGLAFLDVLPRLPGWLHVALLVVFGLGTAVALALAFRRFPWPSRDEARTALEVRGAPGDHRLPYHRPLTALSDQPSRPVDDPLAAGLWSAHRARMLAAARRLAVPFPAPRMASRDPVGIRAVGVLLVVVGVAIGWGDLGQRLDRALNPTLPPPLTTPLTADLWITPPAYTGRPPLTLTVGGDPGVEGAGAAPPRTEGPLRVPEGSTLVALVHGAEAPVLRTAPETAGTAFEAIGDGSHRLEAVLERGTQLVIADDGERVLDRPMTIVPDVPPSVTFAGPPEETTRWRLQLPYAAGDDYGIDTFVLQVTRPDRADAETLEVALDPPPRPAPDAGPVGDGPVEQPGAAAVDLASHPWAGLPVTVRLKATDAAGQSAMSDAIDTVLPERVFQHPVARAIAAVRKEVARDPAPDTARDASRVLDEISRHPDRFGHDSVVFLGLRVASDRLYHAPAGAELASVMDLLWDLALRLEDGGLTMAGRELERAEDALREALENGAPDAEIERLLTELQRALQQFSEQLAEMMRDMPQMQMPMTAMPPDMQSIDPSAMREMLERMRELTELGAREAAQAMLEELSRMMDAMRNMQPMTAEQMQQMQQMQDMMRELQRLTREQERLLEESFERSQRDDRPGDDSGQQAAERQEELRRQLGDLMRRMGEMAGEIPDNLGQAEMAMRQAEEALQGGRFGPGAEAQGEALQALRDGMGQSMQQMMQAMGMGMGMMPMQTRGTMPGRDPLGRQGVGDERVEVPTEPEEKRARELLEELRRRAGERERPQPELDYLHRLLRQF